MFRKFEKKISFPSICRVKSQVHQNTQATIVLYLLSQPPIGSSSSKRNPPHFGCARKKGVNPRRQVFSSWENPPEASREEKAMRERADAAIYSLSVGGRVVDLSGKDRGREPEGEEANDHLSS